MVARRPRCNGEPDEAKVSRPVRGRGGNPLPDGSVLTLLSHREDRDNEVRRPGGPDRWVDCGLGGNWREIIDNLSELQSQKVLMRSLIIRPPQEQIAQLEEIDPDLWARRRQLMAELVEGVMAAEMERRGVEWPGGRQPLDLAYSYVIHAPPDANGVESLHAHVITPAMDREREQAFNVYRRDTQHTREVAERETERIFELSRVRDREPTLDLQPQIDLAFPDRDIEFHGR
jgi:hypothetical protein